jgi:hypothetical protein
MNEWPIEGELDERLRRVVIAEIDATDPREITFRPRPARRRYLAGAAVAVIAVAALVAALVPRQQGPAPVGASPTPIQAPSASPQATPAATLVASPAPTPEPTPGPTAGPTADPGIVPGKTPPCGGDGPLVPLADGRVLAVGNGCESAIFDPNTRTFAGTGSTTTGRYQPTGTLLQDGRVLVAGGDNSNNGQSTTDEIFDPRTGRFTPTGAAAPGDTVVSVLLANGRVLLVGSQGDADVFDPASGTFTATGPMTGVGSDSPVTSAARLGNGKVLVVDVSAASAVDAQIYDPASNSFAPAGKTTAPRDSNASLASLPDGRVMLFGGGSHVVEAYDATSGTFSRLASMPGAAEVAARTTLTDGRVLAITVTAQEEGLRRPAGLFDVRPAAGRNAQPEGATVGLVLAGEIYDPGANKWSDVGQLDLEWMADYGASVANSHPIAALPGGGALITGITFGGGPNLADVFDPKTGKFILLG